MRFNDVLENQQFTIGEEGVDAPDYYTYFQIDGEFYKARNVTSMTL